MLLVEGEAVLEEWWWWWVDERRMSAGLEERRREKRPVLRLGEAGAGGGEGSRREKSGMVR